MKTNKEGIEDMILKTTELFSLALDQSEDVQGQLIDSIYHQMDTYNKSLEKLMEELYKQEKQQVGIRTMYPRLLFIIKG